MSVSLVWLQRRTGIPMAQLAHVGTQVDADGGPYFYNRDNASMYHNGPNLAHAICLRYAAHARRCKFYNVAREWIATAQKIRESVPR